jgi:hypothetical protein
MHIPKWLIATAALLFVVLIASVAFFIGRDTAQPPEAAIEEAEPAEEPPPVKDTAPEPAAPVADAGGATTSPITSSAGATVATDAPPSTASASLPGARARVSAYFSQMEALGSGAPIGDQEAFATAILQGATSGDFSGIDRLVRTAEDAERGAAAIQPPGECAEYHRLAVTLLQESRTMVIALRDGLKRNDTSALTSLGASAQSMKSRADTLAAAEKALRTRFGL